MKPIASSHNLAAGAAAESLCDDVAWLHELVLEFLISEAADKASFETGGLLMGYLSASQGVPVILLASGPGPRAVHSRTRYRPDYQYDEARVAQVYEQSQGRVLYLGDWHTQPESPRQGRQMQGRPHSVPAHGRAALHRQLGSSRLARQADSTAAMARQVDRRPSAGTGL